MNTIEKMQLALDMVRIHKFPPEAIERICVSPVSGFVGMPEVSLNSAEWIDAIKIPLFHGRKCSVVRSRDMDVCNYCVEVDGVLFYACEVCNPHDESFDFIIGAEVSADESITTEVI